MKIRIKFPRRSFLASVKRLSHLKVTPCIAVPLSLVSNCFASLTLSRVRKIKYDMKVIVVVVVVVEVIVVATVVDAPISLFHLVFHV